MESSNCLESGLDDIHKSTEKGTERKRIGILIVFTYLPLLGSVAEQPVNNRLELRRKKLVGLHREERRTINEL